LIEQDSNISRIQNPESISEKTEAKKRAKVFVPPTIEEATAYAKEIGFQQVAKWMDHYKSNGWMVGKVKMKDWKSCMNKWNREPQQQNGFQRPQMKLNGFSREYHEAGRITNKDGSF